MRSLQTTAAGLAGVLSLLTLVAAPQSRGAGQGPPPEPVAQVGHSAFIANLAFSADDRWLVTSGGSELILWDPRTGLQWRSLRWTGDGAERMALSAAGERIAGASRAGGLAVWDRRSGRRLWTRNPPPGYLPIRALAFTPDGRRLLCFRWDGSLESYDPATGAATPLAKVQPSFGFESVFSPDRSLLLCGGSPVPAKVVTVATGRVRYALEESGDEDSSQAFSFSPEGRLIAGGLANHQLGLWETSRGRLLRSIPLEGPVFATALSRGGRYVAARLREEVGVWEVSTGKLLWKRSGTGMRHPQFVGTPERLVVTDGWSIAWWDPRTGTERSVLAGHSSRTRGLAAAPGGNRLATTAGAAGVLTWDTSTGHPAVKIPALRGDCNLTYSPDGRLLAGANSDRLVQVVQSATGIVRHRFTGARGGLRFSPDGRFLVGIWGGPHSGASSPEVQGRDRGKVWDLHLDRLAATLNGPEGPVSSVDFSPDGEFLAMASANLKTNSGPGGLRPQPPGAITFFNREWQPTGKRLEGPRTPGELLLSPDGRYAAVTESGLSVFDLRPSGPRYRPSYLEKPQFPYSFLPSGELLTGSTEGCLKAWDPQTGRVNRVFPATSARYEMLAVPRRGTRCFAGTDQGIEFWDTRRAALLATLVAVLPTQPTGETEWVIYTPEGYYDRSPGAAARFRWRGGGRLLTAAEVDAEFFRPDRVQAALRE